MLIVYILFSLLLNILLIFLSHIQMVAIFLRDLLHIVRKNFHNQGQVSYYSLCSPTFYKRCQK